MLSKNVFAQTMTMLFELYEKQQTTHLMAIYYNVLGEMNDTDFEQAVMQLIKTRVYPTFPKPAEILELSQVVEVHKEHIDTYEVEAKRLIDLVRGMNNAIYQEHIKSGISFDTLLAAVKFPKVSESDIAVLNQVKPYCDLKQLVGNINHYQTSLECLKAFKNALKYSGEEVGAIENNSMKNLRIKR